MAVTTNVDMSALDKYIQSIPGIADLVKNEFYKAGMISMDAYKQAVVLETPVNSGQLRRGYIIQMEGSETGLRGRLYNPMIYTEPVEYGRKSGKMPPASAIALWVIRKGIADRKHALQVAWLIARAIGAGKTEFQQKGGAKMFEKGFASANPAVKKYWDGVCDNIVKVIGTMA